MTPAIRKALNELGAATVAELADRLHIQDFAKLRQLEATLQELRRRGVVVREERPPLYRLAETQVEGKQEAVWRAAQVNAQGFTIKQITRLSGASADYARRYVSYLCRLGLMEKVGLKGRAGGGVYCPEMVYRIIPGQERARAPHWARRREEAERGQKAAAD